MTRDQFLTEKMGECYHEWESDYIQPEYKCDYENWGKHYKYKCKKCFAESNKKNNINFSTWEGFGKLWEWAKGQEWWLDFIFYQKDLAGYGWEKFSQVHLQDLIDPDRFADAVANYLGWRVK